MINFERVMLDSLRRLASSFPIVAIVGPRQSGKTTLARTTFPDYHYISLEDIDNRLFAESDPRSFLAQYSSKVIIDEIQRVPSLFSYLQTHVDNNDYPGQYILTGSAHLMLLENLTQSLAGRAALLKLLPLSFSELKSHNTLNEDPMEQLYHGFYPRPYKHQIKPTDWYPNYIQTYLEKDVRELINIKNLLTFKKFLALCAGRHGQLLEIESLANDVGVSRQTIKNWLSILEASFLIYFLPPFHRNFNKRLVKSPKLFFYDSGLVCSLLNIENSEQLRTHYQKGAIFEGAIITELMKYRYNQGLEPHLYFWKEKNGLEVDCIIEKPNDLLSLEIKSGKTINKDFFKGIKRWQSISSESSDNSYLIYSGSDKQKREHAFALPWNELSNLLDEY